MLKLNRKVGESIIIVAGEDVIVVTVDAVTGKTAKIAVQAPANITIDREEIYAKKQREKDLDRG